MLRSRKLHIFPKVTKMWSTDVVYNCPQNRLSWVISSRTTIILRFTSHETNIYVFTLLKNRGHTKCQKRYITVVPFCKTECFDGYLNKLTRVLRTLWKTLRGYKFPREASFTVSLSALKCEVTSKDSKVKLNKPPDAS